MTAEDYGLARRMWHQLEPVHAVFWYAPEVFEEAARLGYGVQTRWPSYFAWRLAPLGAVGPRLAASACYSFSPDVVTAHVPAAWAVASPPQILAARERAVDRMYRALLADLIGSPGLAEAAELAREAALAVRRCGPRCEPRPRTCRSAPRGTRCRSRPSRPSAPAEPRCGPCWPPSAATGSPAWSPATRPWPGGSHPGCPPAGWTY